MSWTDFYNEIIGEIDRLQGDSITGCADPFFRGLSNNSHKLLPTLFRNMGDPINLRHLHSTEMTVFNTFESNSAMFHSNYSREPWETLYEMRHHNIPTRLLDWTGNFAIALYFALRNYDEANTPCVWILNPITLNEKSVDRPRILCMEPGSELDYKKMFVTLHNKPFKNPIAIYPVKSHPRLLAQNSFFTVHGSNLQPLNEIYGDDVLKRYDIPRDIIPEAKKFLKLSNMNEFTLFPDLDGLGRKINETFFPE
jgi:hypothetical protein